MQSRQFVLNESAHGKINLSMGTTKAKMRNVEQMQPLAAKEASATTPNLTKKGKETAVHHLHSIDQSVTSLSNLPGIKQLPQRARAKPEYRGFEVFSKRTPMQVMNKALLNLYGNKSTMQSYANTNLRQKSSFQNLRKHRISDRAEGAWSPISPFRQDSQQTVKYLPMAQTLSRTKKKS